MRDQARTDRGVGAACILAALGNDIRETDAEYVRAMTGAAILWEACTELAIIRKALTTTKA